jgi:hypothetical protein
MKKPRWLPQWESRKESSDAKSETIKELRQRTDQRMKQQEVQKSQREEAKSSRADGVHRDQLFSGSCERSRRTTALALPPLAKASSFHNPLAR